MTGNAASESPGKEPLVTICIPVYNSEKTLGETLASIVAQTYKNLEILIVDNCSTDGSIDIVNSFRDPRIRVFRNDSNIGCEPNWSKSIALASGEYTALFHSDDLYDKRIVEKQVSFLVSHPMVLGVFTRADFINWKGDIVGFSGRSPDLKDKESYSYRDLLLSVLRNGNTLVTPSPLIRSDTYKKLTPFRYDSYGTASDLDMWLRLAKDGGIAILEEHLMKYRMLVKKGMSYYQYNYLRTGQEDFFKVLDGHLSDLPRDIQVPKDALELYDLRRNLDYIKRGQNHLIKGEVKEAKKLLGKLLSTWAFMEALKHINRPKYLITWIGGVGILFLTNLGLDKPLGRLVHWYVYVWRKRRIIA